VVTYGEKRHVLNPCVRFNQLLESTFESFRQAQPDRRDFVTGGSQFRRALPKLPLRLGLALLKAYFDCADLRAI
jgi:hypothetical protein